MLDFFFLKMDHIGFNQKKMLCMCSQGTSSSYFALFVTDTEQTSHLVSFHDTR